MWKEQKRGPELGYTKAGSPATLAILVGVIMFYPIIPTV